MVETRWTPGIANEVTFPMVDAADVELAGLTLSVFIRYGGGNFQAASGTWNELVGVTGWYNYISSVAEAVIGPISIVVTAAGAKQQNLEYVCGLRDPGAVFYPYLVTDQPGGAGTPVQGAYVWVTRTPDEDATVIWAGYSDIDGYAKDSQGNDPLLPTGNCYFWKFKPGYIDDDNPDLEVVS